MTARCSLLAHCGRRRSGHLCCCRRRTKRRSTLARGKMVGVPYVQHTVVGNRLDKIRESLERLVDKVLEHRVGGRNRHADHHGGSKRCGERPRSKALLDGEDALPEPIVLVDPWLTLRPVIQNTWALACPPYVAISRDVTLVGLVLAAESYAMRREVCVDLSNRDEARVWICKTGMRRTARREDRHSRGGAPRHRDDVPQRIEACQQPL